MEYRPHTYFQYLAFFSHFLPVLFKRFYHHRTIAIPVFSLPPVALPSAGVHFLLRNSNEDSVTQREGQVTLSEGTSLTVNCSYETKQYPALLWYVQYPGESLQFLLKVIMAGAKGSNRGFEATYDKGSSSFHLEKASVQESDSAVYYCALGDTVSQTAGGAEHKLRGSMVWLLSTYL
ncbi:T cell receptor alpha variable 9-1 [Lemmus lemmus]